LEISGNPVDGVITDSYNSSNGTYAEHTSGSESIGKKGDLIYAGDIILTKGSGSADIKGGIESGRTVDLNPSSGNGQPDVHGNISYTNSCIDCDARIVSPGVPPATKIDGIETASSVDWFVNNSIEEVKENADAVDPYLPGDGDTELTESKYYFNSLVIEDGDELELNTTDNNMKIAVKENIKIKGRINITGDGIVRMFVGGEGIGTTRELYMADGTQILTPGDDATQFRLYGKGDFRALIGESSGGGNAATYVGVLYAPPGELGKGNITLKGSRVRGGILTGKTVLDKSSIHYDEALLGTQIIPPDANQLKVTFLHVTVNEIRVEG